jgi:hypothetical protein
MLIGLQSSTGAQSGKDTVATMFQQHMEIERYALADPIKECINELFNWDERHSEGALKEVVLPIYLPTYYQWQETVGNFYRQHVNLLSLKHCIDKGNEIAQIFNQWCWSNRRVVTPIDADGDPLNGIQLLHMSPREAYQIFGTEMMRGCVTDSFWIDIAPIENVIITDIRFPNEVKWIEGNKGILIDVVRPHNESKIASHSSESGTGVEGDIIINNQGSLEDLENEVLDAIDEIKGHL